MGEMEDIVLTGECGTETVSADEHSAGLIEQQNTMHEDHAGVEEAERLLTLFALSAP